LADEEIDTLTGSHGFTVIVTRLDVAGFPVVHPAFEVNTQDTVFPFAGIKL
jgi:hypothetical protein